LDKLRSLDSVSASSEGRFVYHVVKKEGPSFRPRLAPRLALLDQSRTQPFGPSYPKLLAVSRALRSFVAIPPTLAYTSIASDLVSDFLIPFLVEDVSPPLFRDDFYKHFIYGMEWGVLVSPVIPWDNMGTRVRPDRDTEARD
jgi:hypothetical protein